MGMASKLPYVALCLTPVATFPLALCRTRVQLPEDGAGRGGLAGRGVRLRQHHALRQEHLLQVIGAQRPPPPSRRFSPFSLVWTCRCFSPLAGLSSS